VNTLLYITLIDLALDPANKLLGLKAYLLLPLIFAGYYRSVLYGNQNKVCPALLIYPSLYYIAITIGSFSMILGSVKFDSDFYQNYWTFGITLILISFASSGFRKTVVNALLSAGIIISLLTIGTFVYLRTFINDAVSFDLALTALGLSDTFIIYRREVLGITTIMAYHKSSSILIILLAYLLVKKEYLSKSSISLALLFTVTLFLSGTRANMLAAFLIWNVFIVFRMHYFRKREALYFIIFAGSFIFFAGLIYVIIVGADNSSLMKMGHFTSILKCVTENSQFLLFGMGPGSLYYSEGYGELTALSELTFLEFLRMFGLIGSFFIFFLFLYPMRKFLYGPIELRDKYFLLCYLAFFFVGSTNPLLIGNLGACVLLITESVTMRINKKSAV
jgi:hypothetical protein